MLQLFAFFACLSKVLANYNGPFLLWGRADLKSIETSALQSIDDTILKNIYSEASAIMVFVKNSSSKLTAENYPSFRSVIENTYWSYLPQHFLPSDPADFNVNAEVIHLVGPESQQDIELTALYKDSVNTYGDGKVLGILASRTSDHEIRKREAEESSTTTGATPTTEETIEEGHIYIADKAILYTTSPPIIADNESSTDLRAHGLVTSDERGELLRLSVMFPKVNRSGEIGKLTLRFRFPISNGYWSLSTVEVEGLTNKPTELNIVGEIPSAPMGFSYKCTRTLVFGDGSITLTLENIQVQPEPDGLTQFSDAFDCIGFTTAPIWSGIFVTALVGIVLTIAILCILDIRPPNRFESTRGKQLTFTVQE